MCFDAFHRLAMAGRMLSLSRVSVAAEPVEDETGQLFGLPGLEDVLGMSAAREDDELLGPGRPVELLPDASEAAIAFADNEELASLETLGRGGWGVRQQNQAVDFTRLGGGDGGGGGTSAHAASQDGDAARARLAKVFDRAEHVEVERAGLLGLTAGLAGGLARSAVASKVDRQDPQPGGGQTPGERIPALFVEDGSMGEHDSVIALAIEVGVDAKAVARGKGDFLKGLRRWGGAWQ